MILKTIEMFGFKSFADRTRIEFEPGITAIVGPNGCGKSNIVDALKWVLGEKQARNIRGTKMEDVIFSGTDQRKQLSMSEVSITFDNGKRILDIDSETVTISRRMFRDGESEYLINKSPVRLKDIDRLFMDTGIGKSAYSVMEQGKMDLILSNSAEDRRYIFEEAAGISKYKLQKKESLKKLTETGENLNRINDIIREIEREKDFKARQAEKTKEYLSLREKQVSCDIKSQLYRYRDHERRLEKLQNDIEKNREERAAVSARISAISAENERDEKKKNDIQHQLFEEEKKLHTYRIRVEDIDVKTGKNRNLIDEQVKHTRNVEKNITERTGHMERLIEEKGKTEKSGVEVQERIREDREKLGEFYDRRKNKIESIHRSRDTIEGHKASIEEKESRVENLRGDLEEVVKQLVDAIEKRKEEMAGSEEERQKVRERIHSHLSVFEDLLRKALQAVERGGNGEVSSILDGINIPSLREDIHLFEGFEDGFRSILFDKTGIHARKEKLDAEIAAETDAIGLLRDEITSLEEFIRSEQQELEDINAMINRIEKDLSRNENERDWIEKHIVSLSNQIRDFEKQIENYNSDIKRSRGVIERLEGEIREWDNKLVEFNKRSESLLKNISELVEKRNRIEQDIAARKSDSRKDEEELKKIDDRIVSLDHSRVEVEFKKNGIEDYLWVEYEKKMAALSAVEVTEADYQGLQAETQDLKRAISELGPINNLAIEEYRDLVKRFEYYIKQKTDIEKARGDIVSVIEDINKTSVEMFISTFNDIQRNFLEIFKRLFEGGEANLELTDPENVLESGIDIMVRPPGKKLKNINLLSGGERALTAIALLFATYMAKPSPFCFLDEIDAPLDEENIGRFVKMLKEFARGTQFIIVTHNKKTMRITDLLYGVTMEEPGISRVISLRMDSIEEN